MKLDRTWRWVEKPCYLLALLLACVPPILCAAAGAWTAVLITAAIAAAQILVLLYVMWLGYLRAAARTYRPWRGWRPS